MPYEHTLSVDERMDAIDEQISALKKKTKALKGDLRRVEQKVAATEAVIRVVKESPWKD